MTIRLAATAYCLPPSSETVASIIERERHRVESVLATIGPDLRHRAVAELGIEQVRVCGPLDPYELMVRAARTALKEADIAGPLVDLIVDYSTLSGESGVRAPSAHRLSLDLRAEKALNLSSTFVGCAGLHLALRQATALMHADDRLKVALLVAADSPPPGNRSLLPITIQGDAGSAAVLRRDGGEGAEIVTTAVLTLGHLDRVITLEPGSRDGGPELRVDTVQLVEEVSPVYYLHFYRLVHQVLSEAHLTLSDIDHVVYSNVSQRDREGFVRALGLPPEKVKTTGMAQYGHTFASDLVLNYTDLRRGGAVQPGQWLLFASAGIGFTWGVTLVRT